MGGLVVKGAAILLSATLTFIPAKSLKAKVFPLFTVNKPNNTLSIKESPLLDFPKFKMDRQQTNVTASGNRGPNVTGANDTVSVSGSRIVVHHDGTVEELRVDGLEQKFGCSKLEDAIFEMTEFDNGRREFYFIMQKGILMVHKRGLEYQAKDMQFKDGSSFGKNPVYFMLNGGGIFATSESYSIICAYKHGIRRFSTLGLVEAFGPLISAKMENFYVPEIDQPVIKMLSNGNEKEGIIFVYTNQPPGWTVVEIGKQIGAGAYKAGGQCKSGQGAGFSPEDGLFPSGAWKFAHEKPEKHFSSTAGRFSSQDTVISFEKLEKEFGKPVACKTIPESLPGAGGIVYVSGIYVVLLPRNVSDLSLIGPFVYELSCIGPITSAQISFDIDPKIGPAAYIYDIKGKNRLLEEVFCASTLDGGVYTFVKFVTQDPVVIKS